MTTEKSLVRPGGINQHFQDEKELKATNTQVDSAEKMDDPTDERQEDQRTQD